MSNSSATTRRPGQEDSLDLIFIALANPTRRALLSSLGQSPAKITDLAAPYNMSLPAVHLPRSTRGPGAYFLASAA